MKKRILALLFAGLLTASLASCVSSGNQNDPDDTEPPQNNYGQTTEKGDDTSDPGSSDLEWTSVDDSIYTYKQCSLRAEPSTKGDVLQTLDKEVKLSRTKVSKNWSYVQTSDGTRGYVSNSYVTTTDILGNDFSTITERTMYATAGVKVRLYPCTDDFSKQIGTYSKDDAVTVVATNGKWYKVKYKTKENGTILYYYVSASYLSDEKGGTSVDVDQYEGKFTELETPLIRYTTADQLNIRTAPVVDKTTLLYTLEHSGVQVTVLKTGTVDDSNWSYVKVTVEPEKEGDPAQTLYGYVNSKYLTEKVSVENMTLEQILNTYPQFTQISKTLYVVKEQQLVVRSTPVYIDLKDEDKDNNYVDTLKSLTKIEVVGKGANDGLNWYIIKTTEKDATRYRFISASASFTTPNENGEWQLTLDNLLDTYQNYTLLDTPRTITATAKANGYYKPETNNTVPYTLKVGESAKLVAKETGSNPTWYVIQVGDTLYFVPAASFNETVG